jgi:hypothetical protein
LIFSKEKTFKKGKIIEFSKKKILCVEIKKSKLINLFNINVSKKSCQGTTVVCPGATVCKYAGYNNTCTYKLYPTLSSEEIDNKTLHPSILQHIIHPRQDMELGRPPTHPFSHPLLPKELSFSGTSNTIKVMNNQKCEQGFLHELFG